MIQISVKTLFKLITVTQEKKASVTAETGCQFDTM